VPVGTLVYDDQSGRLLKDMVHNEQSVVVGRGGKGGRGNARFATATHQVPREREPGEPGAERTLRLELKLIADVGLVGLPNAGKSTLLSRMTNARPKVAAYPFTTQTPQLGITELPGFRRIVLADIPGLMEGAHDGVGLGDTFLRHIERTRLIVHLIDLCPPEGGPTPIEAYRTIRTELERYSPRLAASAEIIVGNKMDLTDADAALEDLRKQLDRPVVPYSGATGHNQRQLAEAMWLAVQNAKLTEPSEAPAPIDFGNPTASASDGPEDFGGLDLRIDPKPPARTDPAESEGREP